MNSVRLMPNGFRISSAFPALVAGFCVALGLWLIAPLALAQDASAESDEQTEQITDEAVEASEQEGGASPAIEEVVVTGSRLKRDTFSSIAPLQIISGQLSREAGLMDVADILQGSTASSGQQVDLTFQGFVLDNGPGASTIDLRGLDPERTLVLLNSRRLSPAGVEGAPVLADSNLIPASLVSEYELLLDGASSVYGSDAVAGVVNVLLRKDFDGFEFDVFSQVPEYDNGQNHILSLSWGRNFDRGFVGVGAEYEDYEPVRWGDRPWTEGCTRHAEIDENSVIRSLDLTDSELGMRATECARGRGSLVSRVFQAGGLQTGSIYATPGTSNGGWPGFSEPATAWFGVDTDGDGEADLSYIDYSTNKHGIQDNRYLFPKFRQSSAMAYGEYTLEGEFNLTPYFEFLYSERKSLNRSGPSVIFPDIPANNPFNLCNPQAAGGVDCGEAQSAFYRNPGVLRAFEAQFGGFCSARGFSPEGCLTAFGFIPGPVGAVETTPIVSVLGDRTEVSAEVWQSRAVAGISGDLPFLNVGPVSGWSFDASLIYSMSRGTAGRVGVREDRLELSAGTYSTTNTPCENNTGEELAFDTATGCVPVNWFAPSLYPTDTLVGDFATTAERDYLLDSRDFKTEYEQTIASLFATGTVFELPYGPINVGVGFEWRKDEIESLPDHVAAQGLMFGFFSDGGAVGDKVIREAFAEVEIPVIAGEMLAQELTLNLSTRLTDDEYYGTAWTESIKLGYRPVSSLIVRATYGTSYRAPNLRELFLEYQTGFLTLFDPCFVPDTAIDDLMGGYNPDRDDREPEVLANCRANGVDPTVANNNGNNSYSMELARSGRLDLEEETSRSWTGGFAWDQPFTNAFDLSIGATYYNIEVRNTIIEPGGQFMINDCYGSITGNSQWCQNIERDLSDPEQPFITFLDQQFNNRDTDEVTGVDINLSFEDVVTIRGQPFEVVFDLVANRTLQVFTLDDFSGTPEEQQFEGEWGYPDWKYQTALRVDWERWRLSWTTNYIDGMKVDQGTYDDWSQLGDGGIGNTCLGPPDDVRCRDIGWTSDYLLHSMSLFYGGDFIDVLVGVRNIFDTEPPFVDGTEVFSISNTPIGVGYDLVGRRVFLNLSVNLGGGE